MPTVWAQIDLLAFVVALCVAWLVGAGGRPLTRPTLAALAALVVVAAVLRGVVVPQEVFRGHYNALRQVRLDLDLLGGRDTSSPMLPGGHGVPLTWVSRVVGVGAQTYFGLNVTYGVLAVPVAFLALRTWLREDDRAALVGAALLALDPVHARCAASEDPMALAALCAWCGFLGLGLALRRDRAGWLLLTAAALAFSLAVKTDAALVVVGLAAVAWCDGLRGRWSRPADRAALALALAWVAASLAAVGWSVARHPDYAQHRQYLGMPAVEYLINAAKFPFALLFHNPLVDPRYAPPATSLLAFVGLALGLRDRRRETAGWLLFLALLFVRIYQDFPLPFDDTQGVNGGVKGDVRWNLHASVPWLTLAACGVQRVLALALAPWPRAGLAALGLASLAPTAGFWQHRWTDQQEAGLVRAAAHVMPLPCALVTPWLAGARDRRSPSVDPALPLVLLDLEDPRWRGVPRVGSADLGPPGVDARWSCAAFYRGLGCYVWPLGSRPPASQGERPECRRLFADGGLAPVRGSTLRAGYEDYSAFHVVSPVVELGFYRAVVAR